MEEERQRKVQAGKEKFAQLMKKKNTQDAESERRKKKHKRTASQDTADISNFPSPRLSTNLIERNGDSVLSSTKLTEGSIDSNFGSSSLGDSRSSLQFSEECSKCSVTNFTELDLSRTESQCQIDKENTYPADFGMVTINQTELKLKLDSYTKKIQEYQNALQHRDEIISQLSSSLQTTIENRDQLQLEAHGQAETLATEIDNLKHQLHQATELLRNQKGKNNISSQELLDAKNQVITFQLSHEQKDKVIERMTRQMNEEIANWRTIRSNLELQIQQLKLEAAELKQSNDTYRQREEDVTNARNKMEHQLRQQTDEMARLRQFFTVKAKQRDEEFELLKAELMDSKMKSNEIQTEMTAKLDLITKEKKLEEEETMKLRNYIEELKEQHEVVLNQLQQQQETKEAPDNKDSGMDTIMCDTTDAESIIKPFETNILRQCIDAGDITGNLDQVMKEILELKKENERLKVLVNNGETTDSNSKMNSLMESGDHAGQLQTEMSLWKVKYDQVLKEKMEYELILKCGSGVETEMNNSSVTADLKEEFEIRIKVLEEKLKHESRFRAKCEALEEEKNVLIETHMNQINSFEKLKLELDLKVCELESKCNAILKSKQEIENEFVKNGHRPVFSDAYLTALKSERSDASDIEFLVQQLASVENNLSVMKLRLQEEEEIKYSLNAKIAHLVACCETNDQQRTQLKNELNSLQSQLQMAWQQHEKTIYELAEMKKDASKPNHDLNEKNEVESMVEDDYDNGEKVIPDAVQCPEIQSLKVDLREMEERFTEENFMLKKCIEEERFRCKTLMDQLQANGIEIEGSACSGEWIDLNHKMKLLMDSNRELLEEKELLLQQLTKQQEMLASVETRGEVSSQLTALGQQQVELLQRLQQQNENHTRFIDVLQEKDILQEALRREKEALLLKIQEKDKLETKLIHQKVELEHLRFEKRHLEELLLHKDQLEQELQRQRRSLEDDLVELEHHLKDREDMIRYEKSQLQMEMQKKDLVLRKWQSDLKEKQVEYDCLHSTLQAKHEEQACRMQIHLQKESLQRIEQMRAEMDSHHSAALERLKMDLVNQFAMREGRLVECHMAEVTRLQQEQAKLLQENVGIPTDVSNENLRLLDELTKIAKQCESELNTNIGANEQQLRDDIEDIIGKLNQRQLGLIYHQINVEVSKGINQMRMVYEAQIKAANAQAQLQTISAVAEEREKLSKEHKNQMNKTLLDCEMRVKRLKEDQEQQLAAFIGEEKFTTRTLLNQIQAHVSREFTEQVQNLAQQWEKEYLERLANLRREVEEKFREATATSSPCEDEKTKDDNGKRSEELFSQVETILEEKDELINKVTELRKNLEKVQVTEIRILKEHLRSEFNSVVEVQTEMKRDLESNESPVLVELKKIKEEYEKLQEKLEEITKEEIEVEEVPIGDASTLEKVDRVVVNKRTELPGASEVWMEKSCESIKEENKKEDRVTLEEELKKLRTKLEEKHVKDMEQLRIYFEKRCEDMEMKYVDEVSRAKASQAAEETDEEEFVLRERDTRLPTLTHFCDTSHVLESNFMELEEHYKKEFDQKLVQYREQLEEVRKQLEMKHQEELVELRNEMEEKAKEQSEIVRMELVQKYTEEIEDIMRRHREENEVLKNKYAEDLARKITNVRLECASEFASEIEAENKKLVEEIKKEHEREMDNLKCELELKHEKKMEISQMRFDAEKAEEINNAVKELQSNLRKERDQLLERDTCQETSNDTTTQSKWLLKEEEYQKQLELEGCERDKIEKEKEEINGKLKCVENQLQFERSERENEKLTLLESHRIALSGCDKEKQLAVETLRDQFQAEIRELDAKYEEKMRDIEGKWKNQVDESKRENERLKDQHTRELDQLKNEYERELNEEKIKWQEELTEDHIVKFEAVTQELDSCHRLELDEMRQVILKEHEEQMEQLQHNLAMKEKEFRILMQELKENHEKDTEELKEEHKIQLAAEVKRVRQEMENLSEEKVQAIVLDTDAIKAELEDVHRKEIIELQEKISKKHQEEMETEVKRAISDMEKLHESHRKKMIEEHGKKLEATKEEFEENFKSQLQVFSDECKAQKEVEIKAVEKHFEEELARASSTATNEKAWQRLEGLKEPEEEVKEVFHDNDQISVESGDSVKNRRTREKQESDNLITLLQRQLEQLGNERDDVNRDNEHWKQLLSNIVRSYSKVEMIVNRHLTAIANTDISELTSPSKSDGKDSARSASNTLDTSTLSLLSDDALDYVVPDEIDLQNTEMLSAIGNNLELAVIRLLRLLTLTVQQCHESKMAQIDLVNSVAAHGEEAATLEAQLAAEIETKEQLTREIHKALALIENYKIDKEKLEEELRKEETVKENLVIQLEQAQLRIHEMDEEMEDEKSHLDHQRSLISEGLSAHEQVSAVKRDVSTESNLTGDDQGMLQENTQLHAKHNNLQRQSEKDRQQLRKRIQELELHLEEQVTQSEQQLELKRQEIEDLHQQIDALEKQLRADKKFFDAQASEYEQEREEFQREVNRLQNCVREKERQLGTEERLSNEESSSQLTPALPLGSRLEALTIQLENKSQAEEDFIQKKLFVEAEFQKLRDQMQDRQEIVKNLESQLEEKSRAEKDLLDQIKNMQNALDESSQTQDDLLSEIEVLRAASTTDELSMHVQFLEDQLESRSREIDSFRNSQSFMQELRGQLRNLEEKVERKTRELEALQLSASSMSSPSSEDLSLKDQLDAIRSMHVDESNRSASPYYFDDIKRLEDKLEALSKAEEAAIKKTRDLEMTLKKRKQLEEELLQDKEALQQQVNSQLLQISALQARIEEWRHNIDNTDAIEKISRLQEIAERDRELLEMKDKDIEELRDQLEQNRSELIARENEICRLSREVGDEEKNLKQRSAENIALKKELKALKDQFNSMSIPAFAQTLLAEKNQEIDDLNQQLEEMQLSLDKCQRNQSGDSFRSEDDKIIEKILDTEQSVTRKMNEIRELCDILKLSQISPSKVTKKFKASSSKPVPTIASLEKALNEKDEKLKRMEDLLKAGQEEIITFQQLTTEKSAMDSILKQKEADIKRANELAEHRKREVDSLRGVLKEKQTLLEQVETLQGEVASLTEFQTKLQEDYDTVQSMLEDTQKDLIIAQRQTLERAEAHLAEQRKCEDDVAELKSAMATKDNEISNLKDRLNLSAKNGALKQDELQREISTLREQLPVSGDSVEILRRQTETSSDFQDAVEVPRGKHDNQFKQTQDSTMDSEQMSETVAIQVRDVEIQKLKQQKSSLENKFEELVRNEADMKKVLKTTQLELDKLRNDKKAGTDLKKMQQLTEEMKQQIEDHKREFNKTSEELQRAKNYQTTLEMELANIPKLKAKLKETQDGVAAQREETKKWKDAYNQMQTENERLKKTEKRLIQEQQKYQQEFANAVNKCSQSLAEKDKKLNKVESELKQLTVERVQSVEAKSSSLTTIDNDLKVVKENLDKMMEKQKNWEAKDLMQQSEIERLRDEVEQFEESMDTLQNLLDLEKNGKVKLEEEHAQQIEALHTQYKSEMDSLKSKQSLELQLSDSFRPMSADSELNGIEESAIPIEMQSLIQKVHREGVQVLSLSELLYLRSFNQKPSTQSTSDEWKPEAWTLRQAWENEKQQLLAEIIALKDLLTQATEATASLRTTGQATAELSNLLLQAVSTVFQKERESMMAELRTHILASSAASPNEIERLEMRIKEMDKNQQLVLSRVQRLFEEPESLINQDIFQNLNKERMKHLKEREQLLKQITKLECDLVQREKHYKKQMELNDYHLKQEEMLSEDLRHTLHMEKKRTLDLSSQLSHEKGLNADLDTALTLSRSELIKTQTANDRYKREIQSLTAACESEKFRSQALLQAIEAEQANFSQLQEAMEAEKRRCKSSNDRHQQIIQELQRSVEISKENQLKAITALEQERLNHANTCLELERFQNKRNRTTKVDFSQSEFNRNLDLTTALERERNRVVSLNNSLAQERGTAIEDLERERSNCLQIQKKLDFAQEQNFELRRDLQHERERAAQLDAECAQLRTQYSQYRELEMQKQTDWEVKRQLEKEKQREIELTHEQDRQKQRELELEVQKHLQRIQVLEKQMEQRQESEMQLRKDLQEERERNSRSIIGIDTLSVSPTTGFMSSSIQDSHYIETAKQQLQCLVFKCQQELEPIIKHLGVGDSIIQNITSILGTLVKDFGKIKTDVMMPSPEFGDDLRLQQFLEQVLHQNAELIGFVIQLCEDKMQLRNLQLKLEEELVQLRHKQISAEQNARRSGRPTEDTLSIERMAWAQERAALQLSLHKVETEVIQLKCTLQMSGWSTSRESLTTSNAPTKVEDKVRRLHMKYLRAESFRKALIYQKKYLLILLGGFQKTDAETLALISQMGIPGVPSPDASGVITRRHAAYRRFRSVARVVTAIYRMKFMVKRWRKQGRVTAPENQDGNYNTRPVFSSELSENHFALLGSRPTSTASPDDHHLKFHRIGTTPPVRDFRQSERSSSSAKKSLTASITASSGDINERNVLQYLKSDKSLERYLERLESTQQSLGITPSPSPFTFAPQDSDIEQS